MPQNYEVTIAMFGRYVYGNVIPEAVVVAYGNDPAELVKLGTLAPTAKPVNCSIAPPDVKAIPDGTAELFVERNQLRERAEKAELDAQLQAAKVAEQDRLIAARDRAIAKLVDENAHLSEACESHQKAHDGSEKARVELEVKCAALTAELADANAKLAKATSTKKPPHREPALAPAG